MINVKLLISNNPLKVANPETFKFDSIVVLFNVVKPETFIDEIISV